MAADDGDMRRDPLVTGVLWSFAALVAVLMVAALLVSPSSAPQHRDTTCVPEIVMLGGESALSCEEDPDAVEPGV